MRVTIDDLLKEIKTPELPVPPVSSQRQERIQQMTMKKIKSEAHAKRRHPARLAVIAGAAAVLLCGSAFAAYEWNLFDFHSLFGSNAEVLEDHITTFQPQEQVPSSAQGGFTEAVRGTFSDYNVTLIGNPEVSDTLITATFTVSKTDTAAPDFLESGLTLETKGYESHSYVLWDGENTRIAVYAQTDSAPDTLTFSLSDGETLNNVLEDVTVEHLTARTADFSDMDTEDAGYVLDSATATDTSLRVTGHCQNGASADNLDASGTFYQGDPETGYPAPLYDKTMEQFDFSAQQEDVEGYLLTRDIKDDGSFTLEWMFVKRYSGATTLEFGGLTYSLPAQEESEAVESPEITASDSMVTDTQDYRFSLESMTAVPDGIYAIVDVEPLTDYGKANLTSSDYDVLCSDVTHLSNGMASSQIIESSEELVRILAWSVKSHSSVQSGDLISFEVTVMEDGDTASHRYSLFNAPIDSVLTDSVSLTSGDYDTAILTPLTLHLEKIIDLGLSKDASATERIEKEHEMDVMGSPEITLTMTDGSCYPILDGNWHAGDADLGQYGTLGLSTEGEDQDDGSVIVSHTLLFTQPVDLSEIVSVTIDGIVYTVK